MLLQATTRHRTAGTRVALTLGARSALRLSNRGNAIETRSPHGPALRRWIRRAVVVAAIILGAVAPFDAPAAQARDERLADGRQSATLASAKPPATPARFETRHFIILAAEGEGSPTRLIRAGDRAERAFETLRDLLGEARTPTRKLVVALEGSGLSGGDRYPHVDASGVIHLYRFTEEFDDHFDSLLHEMVHAFRRATGVPWVDGFREEGLAQAIVLALDPPEIHFPLYGYPLDFVAGHLLATDRDIPLETLRQMHRQLNLPCRLQAYVQRASFFEYLTREFGLDAVISLVYDRPAGGADPFLMAFGSPLMSLAEGWREDALLRYRALDDAARSWSDYRTTSPAGYFPICERSTLAVSLWL